MGRKATLWALALVLSLLCVGSDALATPTLPYVIVNHSTQECTESILGDDCSWCDPPPGWEVLGVSGPNQCPDGYARLERIDMLCRRYKNEFCCTSPSHHGECKDMVVHQADGLCAFVEAIEGCNLPAGWTARPADVDPAAWICPYGYQWADPVACLSLAPTVEPATAPAPTTAARPVSTDLAVKPGVSPTTGIVLAVVCLATLFIAVVAVGLVVMRVVARRGRR